MQDYKVEVIDYKTMRTTDENIAPKESDAMIFELIDFLIKRQVYGTAKIALEYV